MLHRDVFVSHLLRLILRMNQHFIQILSNKELTALHFRTFPKRLFHTLNQKCLLNPQLFHQL